MKEIKPTYVTFEQAKLLADKRFLIHTRYGYTKDGVLERPHYGETYINSDFENSLTYSAPEQHQVIEWLRINHGIWISVHLELCRGYEGYDFNFEYINDKEKTIIEQEKQYKELGETVFNSPQEACSAAFDYILKELI
jgi:hypothetical protein